jgi:glucose/mannose-6-phosphate isomerase
VQGLPAHDEIENVIVLGMGGSGVAGDLLSAVVGPFMPVPVVVHKGYACPSFASRGTLVFAVSFSGNTEETLEATEMAVDFGAHVIAISSGGELASLPGLQAHVPVPTDIPVPRTGIGAVGIPPMVIAERLGMIPGGRHWIEQATEQLRARRAELERPGNPAEALARRLGRQLPIIYGGGSLGRVAAWRWKNQLNENAKIPAFANEVPELTHNEICGWGQNGDVTRQIFRVAQLRHDAEHPQELRRFELISELMEEVVADIEVIEAAGDGTLAQVFDLIFFGDVLSLEVCALEGTDPGPTPALDHVKSSLRAE